MILKKIILNKEGDVETLWYLTQEQYYLLLNHAINDLIKRGLIEVSEMTQEELEELKKAQEKEGQKMFLEQVDKDDLPRA